MPYPDLPEVPMTCLPGADFDVEQKVTRLAFAVHRSLAEAVISLNLFNTAYAEHAALMPPEWYTDEPGVYESLEPVRRAIAARAMRPKIYYDAAPHLHAQTYVLSLRMIAVYLKTIAREAGPAYPDLENISQAYDTSFPGLKDLRDSINHAEDRLLHLDRKGKQIVPQPVPGLVEGGSAFFSGMLKNRALGWTAGDGTYAQCAVSEATLAVAVHATEALMGALVRPSTGTAPAS